MYGTWTEIEQNIDSIFEVIVETYGLFKVSNYVYYVSDHLRVDCLFGEAKVLETILSTFL